MAEVRETISIGSKADTRGFKKAESAAVKLTKSLRNLAGAFGVTYSTAQVINFGKVSVRAFAEMQAQQDRLTRLMKVGVGASNAQIQSLNNQSKALENLGVVSKGNITQIQSQLATFNLQASTIQALTPSILDYVTAEKGATASTEEFKMMTNGLAQALNGNFGSLTRVGFVIDANTKKLIKNGNESQRAAAIVDVLDSTYKGFNKSLRDTPVGQMALLANAAEDARETIGEGLLDALALLGGEGTRDIEKATTAMSDLATATSDVIRGQAVVLSNLGGIGGGAVGKIGNAIKIYFKEVLGIQALQDLGASTRPRPRAGRFFGGGSLGTIYDPKAKKIASDQLKETKKLTAEQKKQAALKKAGTLFDMDQIQIIAALKGQISDEERKRLELQFALLTGNEEEAKRLTYQIATAQGLGERLAAYLASLPDAKNPFASWEAYLDRLAEKARQVASLTVAAPMGTAAQAAASSPTSVPSTNVPTYIGTPFGQAGSSVAAALGTPFGQAGGNGSGFIGTPFGQAGSIKVELVGNGDQLIDAIASGLQQKSLSTGDSSYINRRTGGFAG